MSAPSTPPVPPWHRRVLDWLCVEPAEGGASPQGPDPGERFPWEPVPPSPRPPQWGAADLPTLLLGQEEEEPLPAGGAQDGDAHPADGRLPPPPHPKRAP